MRTKAKESLWLVVYVFRGMPTRIKLFRQAQLAYCYEKNLRKKINPDYDEAGILVVNSSEITSAFKGNAVTLNALGL